MGGGGSVTVNSFMNINTEALQKGATTGYTQGQKGYSRLCQKTSEKNLHSSDKNGQIKPEMNQNDRK